MAFKLKDIRKESNKYRPKSNWPKVAEVMKKKGGKK